VRTVSVQATEVEQRYDCVTRNNCTNGCLVEDEGCFGDALDHLVRDIADPASDTDAPVDRLARLPRGRSRQYAMLGLSI
jgi:hypothetical protein